jgi:hypothetical protein
MTWAFLYLLFAAISYAGFGAWTQSEWKALIAGAFWPVSWVGVVVYAVFFEERGRE